MRDKVFLVAVTLSLVVIVATGCSSGGATARVASEAAAPVSAAPSAAGTTPSTSVPTAPAVAPDASPSPNLTPSILPITSDDLIDALPTNPMLSKVQGFTFKESKNWVGGGDQGPEWVADAPLTKEQLSDVNLGTLRRVKPDKCESMVAFFQYGWTDAWASGGYFAAVGFTNKVNSLSFWKDSEVSDWGTQAFVMPEGAPQAWTRNLSSTVDECDKFTTVASNGDLERVNLTALPDGWTEAWQESGGAVIDRKMAKIGSRSGILQHIWEPIGNVLYSTTMTIGSDEAKQWARTSALYNRLADSLAKAQGVEREPVDLREGTPLIPHPAEYAPPTGPVD